MESTGDRIVSARGRKGWDQLTLAEKAECDRVQISQWETGKRNPGARSLGKLARALGVRIEWLKSGALPMEAGPLDNLTEEDFRPGRERPVANIPTGGGKTNAYAIQAVNLVLLQEVITAVLREGTDIAPERIAMVTAEVYGFVQRTGRVDRISELARTLLD